MAAIASWEFEGQKFLLYTHIDESFFFRVTLRRYFISNSKPEEEWRHNLLLEPRFKSPDRAIDWASNIMKENGCPEIDYNRFLKELNEHFK